MTLFLIRHRRQLGADEPQVPDEDDPVERHRQPTAGGERQGLDRRRVTPQGHGLATRDQVPKPCDAIAAGDTGGLTPTSSTPS